MPIALAGRLQRQILLIAAVTSIALVVACNPETSTADNSGINERDQNARTMTPIDQSQAPDELARVASLRSALMALVDLSVAGQNIKIITRDGRITLRGPVADATERARIETAMTAAAAGAPIDNQLELAARP